MNERFSRKVSWLRFVCSLMIIGLHTMFPSYFKVTSAGLLWLNRFVRHLCDASISTFFFLSAYLLYRNAEKKNWGQVLLRRVRSLVIPYVLWNAIFYAHQLLREYLTLGMLRIPPTLSLVIRKLTVSPANSILWFVQMLLAFVVLFPVLRWMVRRKWPAWLAAAAALAVSAVPQWNTGYESMPYWLPVYLAGAYLGYWHHERMERVPMFDHRWSCLLSAVMLVAFALLRPLGRTMHYLYWLPAALMMWMMADALDFRFRPPWWVNCSFYLYCSHMVVEHYAVEIYLRLLGTCTTSYVLCHVLLPCLCAFLALCTAAVLRRFMPPLFRLLTGMRK